MKKKLSMSLLLSLTLLSACASRIDTEIKPKYEKKSQIPLNANAVVVRYDFNPTVKNRNSDSLFSRTLTQGVEKWAHARLRPNGQFGIAQVTVRDASITEKGSTYQNPEKLEGTLDVIVSLIDQRGIILGQAEAKVRRDIDAPNNLMDKEKQDLTQVLSVKLLDELDCQMEEAILKMVSSIPISPYVSR